MLPANKKTELQTEKYDERKRKSLQKAKKSHSSERASFFYRFSPFPQAIC